MFFFSISGQGYVKIKMGSGGHLGFMQIMKVVQSCQLGNKAEFDLGPH